MKGRLSFVSNSSSASMIVKFKVIGMDNPTDIKDILNMLFYDNFDECEPEMYNRLRMNITKNETFDYWEYKQFTPMYNTTLMAFGKDAVLFITQLKYKEKEFKSEVVIDDY